MKRLLVLVLAACIGAPAFAGGDAASGKQKSEACGACHGADGNKPAGPDFPRLAGQSPEYIVKALQAYRAGDRSHPTMRGIAKGLSDQDMADVAAYYGGAGKADR